MDKTININLGGTLFQIDEEAYRILRDYLKSIDLAFRNVPGGNETIEDIESRIAEIFQSQKGLAGVITKDNVEAMIAIIGKPEDFGHPTNDSASYTYASPKSRKMFRNPEDTIIGGVCGGIGTYLNSDPVWIRILFVIFALFFGFGFFVYLALWIALPSADTDSRKREMYGSTYTNSTTYGKDPNAPYQTTSKIGNAFNEVFRAIGKVCYIIVRIFLIIFGTVLVLTGFLALLSFVMVFVFKYPGAFSTDIGGMNLSYIPDFLNYIVTPVMVPWIKSLVVLVVSLPLLAIIYGGVRLIFWFRARDGFLWLIGLVLWVLGAAALSIILFNEGISYTETARTSSEKIFNAPTDTIYIISGRKISDLRIDNEISIPDEEYYISISDEKKEIYIRTNLNIYNDDDKKAKLIVKRHSAGRSRLDAIEKAERLQYNFNISGDTLVIDEFFTIPANTKWSFDYLSVNLYAPAGTIIYMDKTAERLFYSHHNHDFVRDPKYRFWLLKEDGLNCIEPDNKTER